MLRVKAFLQKSNINGLGVFAAEFIPKGTVTWVLDEDIDLLIPISIVEALPEPARNQMFHYGYIYQGSNKITLCADDARFMNHSDDANTVKDIAIRDIAAGEEITCNYYDFDDDAPRKLGASKQDMPEV